MDSFQRVTYGYLGILIGQYQFWVGKPTKTFRRLLDYAENQLLKNSPCANWCFDQIVYYQGLKSKKRLLEKNIKEVEEEFNKWEH